MCCLLATLLDADSNCSLYCVYDFFWLSTEPRPDQPVGDNMTFTDDRTSGLKCSDWNDDETNGTTNRKAAEV